MTVLCGRWNGAWNGPRGHKKNNPELLSPTEDERFRNGAGKMSENFFDQYLKAQKAMFDQWQKNLKMTFRGQDLERTAEATDAVPGDGAHDFSRDFWARVQESAKSYQAVMELWKGLSEKNATLDRQSALDIYDTWTKQGFASIRAVLAPNIPEYMKDFVTKSIERLESSSGVLTEYARIWASNEDAVARAWLDSCDKGPKGYIDFLEAWQKSYDATIGKLVNAPSFGKDMEFWHQQKASFDRFIKYNIASTQFYTSLVAIIREASRKVLDDYLEMHAQGTQPKTFEEFYKYWTRIVSQYYEKLLFTDEISSLAGNMVNEMARFKIEYDKLCEIYLSGLPVPKKSDMDDLYKTVHELKREVRRLRKEMADKTASE